ncbi:hypothetical protein HYQ46_000236 [Verticillium longisporum]|nr:hypothetical protein HYQ46_000236 [Verticillium longisporum]
MSVVNGVLVATPPPEGYVVDFDNPQRHSVLTAYVVSAVGMVFALLFMLQRLYVKAFVRHSLGIDDFLLVIAWFAAYINSIVYTIPTCFSKVVILLFLKDINNSQQWYRWDRQPSTARTLNLDSRTTLALVGHVCILCISSANDI